MAGTLSVADEPEQHDPKAAQQQQNSLIGSDDAAAAVDCITSRIANLGGLPCLLLPNRYRWT